MKTILVVGEDALTCALGENLVLNFLPGWKTPLPPINTHGVSKLVTALPRYLEQAKNLQPVLCIADTDRQCAKQLLEKWLPKKCCEQFMLRLAVSEAESWLLADRVAVADFFEIAEKLVTTQPEEEINPKRHLLNLAKRSRNRILRSEIVSATDSSKQGAGYNQHLCNFVKTRWSPLRAAPNAPSLKRAIVRLDKLASQTH